MRRYGSKPRKDRFYRHRPGAYAILLRDNQLLMTFQATPEPEFQLPGGGIDPGENPLQALHREVLEETGWSIAHPRRLGGFRHFTFMEEYDLWAQKICHIYLARPAMKRSEPLEPDHTAVWMSFDEAIELTASWGCRDFLRHLARGQL